MELIRIETHSDSFTIWLNDLAQDRKQARIKYDKIRALAKINDNVNVQVIFSNGELQTFPYDVIVDFDGDTNISSQEILYNKLENVIFAST